MASSTQVSGKDVQNAYSEAVADGVITPASASILVEGLDDQALQGCIGVDIDDLGTDHQTLVANVLDESGSMDIARPVIVEGFNLMSESLQDAKGASTILMSTWSFSTSSRLRYGYTPVENIKPMTMKDYVPGGGTALYDALLDVMRGLVAYNQELRQNGCRTTCVVVVYSDGEDLHSRAPAKDVKLLSADLVQAEFVLAYIGMTPALDAVADDVGFPNRKFLNQDMHSNPKAFRSEIRKMFGQVSKSITRVSQGQVSAAGSNSFFAP